MKTNDFVIHTPTKLVVKIISIDDTHVTFDVVSKSEQFDFGRKPIEEMEEIEYSIQFYSSIMKRLRLKYVNEFNLWWKSVVKHKNG